MKQEPLVIDLGASTHDLYVWTIQKLPLLRWFAPQKQKMQTVAICRCSQSARGLSATARIAHSHSRSFVIFNHDYKESL